MSYSFNFDCLPPSVNHIYKSAHRYGRTFVYKVKSARDFEEAAGYQLKHVRKPLAGSLVLDLVFVFKSPKKHGRSDLDNLLKLTCDLLTANRIIEDDSQIVKIICEKKTGERDCVSGTVSTF